MSRVIAIMGESGSGKTTSMRNLPPEETFYIDCDKKGLSWKGWRKQYSFDKGNYMATDIQNTALAILNKIDKDETLKHIHYCVIDTINGIMVADEMRRMKEKGYDKWQDLALAVYGLIDAALDMREDLTVIFVAHTQTDINDNGYMFTRIKTSGKKLDKIVLESKFPTVLYAKCVDGQYIFETQSNFSTAKSPMGALEKQEPNDIKAVLDKLADY